MTKEQVWAPLIQSLYRTTLEKWGCHSQWRAECVSPRRPAIRIVQTPRNWVTWCNISWHSLPLSPWAVHCFCFKGNVTNHVCQFKSPPEKLPVHRKTTKMIWHCRKKSFKFGLHERWSALTMRQSWWFYKHQWLLEVAVKFFFSVSRMQWQHHTLDCT